MRVLLIAPTGLEHRVVALTTALAWNLTCVCSVEEALEFTRKTEFQAIFVTIGHQPSTAFQAISCLKRSKCSVPIVACLEANQIHHRIRALEVGSLTSVQLPSNREEFEMVVRAIVRHTNTLTSNTIAIGDVVLDFVGKHVQAYGATIPFTFREYQLLELFFLNKGKLVTREKIMNHLYDHDNEPDQKIIDVLVCKIRHRLRGALGDQAVIETVWGLGYRTNDCQQKTSLGSFNSLRVA